MLEGFSHDSRLSLPSFSSASWNPSSLSEFPVSLPKLFASHDNFTGVHLEHATVRPRCWHVAGTLVLRKKEVWVVCVCVCVCLYDCVCVCVFCFLVARICRTLESGGLLSLSRLSLRAVELWGGLFFWGVSRKFPGWVALTQFPCNSNWNQGPSGLMASVFCWRW